MPKYLVVADESWVRNEVHAAITGPDTVIIDHDDPTTAADVAVEHGVDALIVDLQLKAMGGMAVTRAVRNVTGSRESAGLPVILLLDRSADAFLARRAGAVAWITKPFTSYELGEALQKVFPQATAEPIDAE
jgi:DNA-binding response OmpR family regulator